MGGSVVLQKLSRIDSRLLYGVLLVSMVVPLIKPLGLPLTVAPETKRMYDLIESLPPRSAVVISMDCSPGGFNELSPGTIAILNHMAKKDLRVIGIAFWETGPSLLETCFAASLFRHKEYGRDYVNLGYVAGGENAIAAVAKDILGLFPRDFRGNPTAGMAVLQDIKTLSDARLVITVAVGNPGVPEWIRQVGDPLRIPIATVVIAGLVADYVPYIQSKQLVGMLPGLKGAAGYESLIGMPGKGTSGIDAQSIAHLVIIFLVVLGNALHFIELKRTRAGKGGQV